MNIRSNLIRVIRTFSLVGLFALVAVGSMTTWASPLAQDAPTIEPGKRMVILVGGITTHFKSGASTSDDLVRTTWSEIPGWLRDNQNVDKHSIIYFSYASDVQNIGTPGQYWDSGADLRIRPYTCLDTLRSLGSSADNLRKIYDQFPDSNFDIITHSLGGVVALKALQDNPAMADRTHSVTTIDSPVRGIEESLRLYGAEIRFAKTCQGKGESLDGIIPNANNRELFEETAQYRLLAALDNYDEWADAINMPAAEDLAVDSLDGNCPASGSCQTMVEIRSLVGSQVDVANFGNPRDGVVPDENSVVDNWWLRTIQPIGEKVCGPLPMLWKTACGEAHSLPLKVVNHEDSRVHVAPLISKALTSSRPIWSACAAPVPGGATVTPSTPSPGDELTFTATYRSQCGHAPERLSLILDGAVAATRETAAGLIRRNQSGGSFVDGITYQVTLPQSLTADRHSFSFSAYDGNKQSPSATGYFYVTEPDDPDPPDSNPGTPGVRSLSLTATNQIPLDGSSLSSITGTLLDGGNPPSPVEGALISFSTNPMPAGHGWLDQNGNVDWSKRYGYTDANGRVQVRFRPGWTGIIPIDGSASFGLSDSTSFQVVPDPSKVPDFEIDPGVQTLKVTRGGTAQAQVGIDTIHGFWDLLSLTVEGLPDGLFGWFTPNIVQPGETTTLNVSAGNDAPFGSFAFDVIVTGDITHTQRMNIDVVSGSITLTAPIGGELIRISDAMTVTWNFAGAGGVNIYTSVDGGRNWFGPIGVLNVGSELIDPVSSEFPRPTDEARVRLTATNDSSAVQQSGDFTICDPSRVATRVSSPGPGTTQAPASTVNIEWQAVSCNGGVAVDLSYSSDGGSTWDLIAGNVPNNGTYPWRLPSVLGDDYVVRVEATDGTGLGQNAPVDVPFSIGVTGNPWEFNPAGAEVLDIVVAPTNALKAYASIKSSGIHTTEDGGQTWTKRLDSAGERIVDLAVDPNNPSVAYAASLSPKGVYKTTDGGTTWTLHSSGLIVFDCDPGEPIQSMLAVAVAPSNSNRVYASGEEGFFQSNNGGASWSHMDAEGNCGSELGDLDDIVVHSTNPNIVYVVDGRRVYKTLDDGTTWTDTNVASAPGSDIRSLRRALALDPNNPETVFVGSQYGLYRTTNGGVGWTRVAGNVDVQDVNFQDISSVAIDPGTSDGYVGGRATFDHSLYRSQDGGDTWSPFSPCASAVFELAFGAVSAHLIYAGLGNWCEEGIWVRNLDEQPAIFLTAPTVGETLHGGAQADVEWITAGPVGDSITISLSTDGGATWQQEASDLSVTSPHGWSVSNVDSDNARLRAELVKGGSVASTLITGRFTIVPDEEGPVIAWLESSASAIEKGSVLSVSTQVIDHASGVDSSTVNLLISPATAGEHQAPLALGVLADDQFGGDWQTSGVLEGLYNLGVEAQDRVGNPSSKPVMGQVLVFDRPIIAGINYLPNPPDDSRPITICATVTDDSQLGHVTLVYRLGDSPGITASPMIQSNGEWCTVLERIPQGLLYYRIEAVDAFLTEATTPETAIQVIDGTPPQVWQAVPLGDDVEWPIDSDITIGFSEAMDRSVTLPAVSIEPPVQFETQWSSDAFGNDVLTLSPIPGLASGQAYEARVSHTAADVTGILLDGDTDGVGSGAPADDFVWTFTTQTIVTPVPTGDPVRWDAGETESSLLWTVTNPSDGNTLDWAVSGDADWLTVERDGVEPAFDGSGTLDPGETVSFSVEVSRLSSEPGDYTGSVSFAYGQTGQLDQTLPLPVTMTVADALCASDQNGDGMIDFPEAVSGVTSYLVQILNEPLGRPLIRDEALRLVTHYLLSIPFECAAEPVLEAHLPFDEGQGAVAADATGNGHDGVVTDGEWVQGVSSTALQFDGVTSIVTVTDTSDLDGMDELTVDAWVHPLSRLPVSQTVAAKWGPGGMADDSWFLRLVASSGQVYFTVSGYNIPGTEENSDAFTTEDVVPLNQWTRITAVYKRDEYTRVYINGELKAEGPAKDGAVPENGQPVHIGNLPLTPENAQFHGCIDEVKIWNGVEIPGLVTPLQGGCQPPGSIVVDTTADEFDTGAPAATSNTTGTGCSLREAIQSANTDTAFGGCTSGNGADLIILQTGATYALTILGTGDNANATGDLDVTSEILIQGNGAFIDGQLSDRVLHVLPGADLEVVDGTIQNGRPGSGEHGEAIRNQGALTLTGATVSGSQSGRGGGILNDGGTASIVDSTITANSTSENGGGIHNRANGTLTVTGGTISSNVADGGSSTGLGGGVYNGSLSSTLYKD